MCRQDTKRNDGVDDGMIGDKVAFFGLPPQIPFHRMTIQSYVSKLPFLDNFRKYFYTETNNWH
jgi:hypothetical protein